MLSRNILQLNQINTITFVLVDAANVEVAGAGGGYTLEISKDGGAFIASAGTKTEISDGWYKYVSTAGEADTIGPVSIHVNTAGAVQQNLEYVVKQRTAGAVEYPYIVKDTVFSNPLPGVQVWHVPEL